MQERLILQCWKDYTDYSIESGVRINEKVGGGKYIELVCDHDDMTLSRDILVTLKLFGVDLIRLYKAYID